MCAVCEKGQYCGNAGNSAPDGDCAPGYVCAENSAADHRFKDITPRGTYAPGGSFKSTDCAAGKYAPIAGLSECLECPAGKICDDGAIRPQACPAGYFCPAGSHSKSKQECPRGTYGGANLTNTNDCTPCEAGHYCPIATDASDIDDLKCSQGYFCPPGSRTKKGRQAYCKEPTSASLECLVGHYCPEGTAVPIPCPRGKYSGSPGQHLQSACEWCPSGQYCDKKGLQQSQGECDAGFYCFRGVDNRRPTSGVSKENGVYIGGDVCPRGYYCPADELQPVACPEGKYSNNTGAEVGCYECYSSYF